MPTTKEMVQQALQEARFIFDVDVKLEKDAEGELERMIQLTVGTTADKHGDVWSRPRFHNFVIGQLALIARAARNRAWGLSGADPRRRPFVNRQVFMESAVAVMTETHGAFANVKGNCAVALTDDKITGLPGDGTQSGPLCMAYLAAIAV